MLKPRNPESLPSFKQPRKDYEKVVELPKPVASPDSRTLQRIVGQAAADVLRQRQSVVEVSLDNAKLNDILLRALMTVPDAVQQDQNAMKKVLSDIVRSTDDILSATGDYKDRRSFGISLENAAMSSYQIARFVREARKKNPDHRFATSVWMDVFYGFDLLRAWPIWEEKSNRLDIYITGYQAKAKGAGGGLEPSEIRNLVSRYEPNKLRAATELEFDPKWILDVAIQEMKPFGQEGFDRAMRDLGNARNLLGSLAENPKTPFEHWRSAYVRAQIAGRFSEALGSEPAQSPGLQQRGKEVNLRFLLDTKKGTEDLTEDAARAYGEAA